MSHSFHSGVAQGVLDGCWTSGALGFRGAALLGWLLLALTSCTALPRVAEVPESQSCASPLIAVDADFDGGNFHRCEFLASDSVLIEIHPEDPPPINPSPWYAFRLSPAQGGTALVVTLQVQDSPVRYWPWVSADGEDWTRLPEAQVQRGPEDGLMRIALPEVDAPLWVAAQELLQPDDYEDWYAALEARVPLQREQIGVSAQGRPLTMLRTEPKPEVVFLLGRQHPPEVTGALAMQHFVDTVFADTPLARAFRERFALVLLPLINPDGVVEGHWRHNTGGVDLNRDWGPFTQPETQAVARLLDSIDAMPMQPRLMLDFHSTQQSRFYTQVAGELPGEQDFATVWHDRARSRIPDFPFRHDALAPSAQQNTKNYFFRRYQIPAITYELGDDVPREDIARSAPIFAEEMMRTLLEQPLPVSGADAGTALATPDSDPRAREAGIAPGIYSPGRWNAITDVAGVRVGHVSLVQGSTIRTGVTAILPHGGNLFLDKVPAGFAQGNGFGKMMGTTQILELGEVETPILLTNTLSVPEAAAGIIEWTLQQPGNEEVRSVNAVVGETNDGRINAIRERAVRPAHALGAIGRAQSGPVEEGSVGAGMGTVNFGWKGGIGSSSRVLPARDGGHTVGVLVQTNYGGELMIMGQPITADALATASARVPTATSPDGSVMIIIATDAPLSDRNLERLAARAFLGIGRTGSAMSNGSGDYALAFSTAESVRRTPERRAQRHTVESWPNDAMTPLFQAVVEATEEAVYNALFKASDVRGVNGDSFPSLPVPEVLRLLAR